MDERRISYCWGNFSSAEHGETGESGDDSHGVIVREQPDASADDDADRHETRRSDTHGADDAPDGHGEDTEPSGRKRGRKGRVGKAAKGRSGRRNATIKTVENLGAAVVTADTTSATTGLAATEDSTDAPGQETHARTDETPDDTTADAVQDASADLALGADHDGSGADETAADAVHGSPANMPDDTGHEHLFDDRETQAGDPAISERPVSDPLTRAYPAADEPALLDIAEDTGGDSLDLAEFVIQAAVSGEDDDYAESAYQPAAWSPADTLSVMDRADTVAERPTAASTPDHGEEAVSDDAAATASRMSDTADNGDGLDIFGDPLTDATDMADEAASQATTGPASTGLSAQDAHAPKDQGRPGRDPLDHRYVSPDLRIPMIDEDDIPSVEAVYLFDDAPVDDAPDTGIDNAAVDTDALAAEADDDTGNPSTDDHAAVAAEDTAPDVAVDDTHDDIAKDRRAEKGDGSRDVGDQDIVAADAEAEVAAIAAFAEDVARDLDADADPVGDVAGDDQAASLTGLASRDSANISEGTDETAQVSTAKGKETDAKAVTSTTTIRRPTASAHHPDAKTANADEGDDDVNASRLFSALSLKRLAVPPHVFEARQRVNVISGLAIIAALGFVGWYFSAPSTIERQLIVETKNPTTTRTAAATVTKDKDPVIRAGDPLVGASGERTGLIYRPLKKVEPTALTAIGDLEYKITPSKFHRVVRVVKGDTFVAVLVRAGVDAKEAAQAIRSMRSIYDPRKLRIGREIRVAFGVAGPEQTRFLGYRFDSSYDRSVHVARQQSGEFASAEVKKNVSESYSRVDGTITSSLFGSGMKAGAPAQTMVQMIHLFSFAVDFQRDLRGGEKFEILFRSHRDEAGRIVRTGEIAYAALTVRGRTHKLYWYKPNKKGPAIYLNEQGQGNRKALMKTPIDGARLTSNFGYRRHPILGYSKLHTGADFGARTGTPIYAAGDGTIVKIGWHGGYGRYIRLRHGKVYQTAYAHMSRFRSGLKAGSRVKQGETIGYVGSTGRSTGPHLHYEVLKNGKHVNPMTITLPSRKRLQGRPLQRFLAHRKEIDRQFASLKNDRTKKQDGAVQTVKSDDSKAEVDAGCKNGIRLNPLDARPCSN